MRSEKQKVKSKRQKLGFNLKICDSQTLRNLRHNESEIWEIENWDLLDRKLFNLKL